MKLVKLGSICDLQNGFAFKSSDYIEFSNTLCCRMSNIRPNATFDIDYNPKYLPDSFSEKFKEYLLSDGDLIIAMTDMANDPKILGVPTQVKTKEKKLLLNQRVGKLISFDLKKVHIPYVKLALSRNELKEYYRKFSGGGIQLNISKQNILNIQIPLPKLAEQIQIAELLNQAENLITQRKESISFLDKFLKSTFLEMFVNDTYPIKTIEDISLNIVDCPHSTPKYQDSISDYPCIRTSEIKNGKIDWTSMKYTDYEGYLQRVERLVPQAGDIIFAREGSVGDAAIIPKDITLSLGQRVMMFRINPDYAVPEYIWALIKSDKIQQIIKSKAIGATVSRINISEVRKIPCPIPSLELQNKFTTIVEKVENLKIKYVASLKELENMYGGLSQKAFKGELNIK